MLGLRHRHAVAGDDDDLPGFLQDERGILGRARFHGRSVFAAPALPLAAVPNPPAITPMKLRFIALHMM